MFLTEKNIFQIKSIYRDEELFPVIPLVSAAIYELLDSQSPDWHF
jgi:hypothetical protein